VKYSSKIFLSVLSSSILFLQLHAAMADSITQYGITWKFDKKYEIGQFANGDYWVLDEGSGVTIKEIIPPMTQVTIEDSTRWVHGWEVNPVYTGKQGFDERGGRRSATSGQDLFDINLAPGLPYTASGGESLVKSISQNLDALYHRSLLEKAVVLTVLNALPPDGTGAGYFRPPYVGTNKPYYPVSDIRSDLLPELDPVEHTPSLDEVIGNLEKVQMDHKGGFLGGQIRPVENVGSDYAPSMSRRSNDAILRLFIKEPAENPTKKEKALILLLQKGIDMYHFVLSGQTWPDGAGWQNGHLLTIAFTATFLNNEDMKTTVANADFLSESSCIAQNRYERGVFGVQNQYWSEEKYWRTLTLEGGGANSERDPYGYIDGGWKPGHNYQDDCVTSPWIGEALTFHLLPEMKSVWNNTNFFDYIDRWMTTGGALTQPDPYSPAPILTTEQWENREAHGYGTSWGPDPKNEGEAILDNDPSDGIGRFPHLNGVSGGLRAYAIAFQLEMWDAYRGMGDETPPSQPTNLTAEETGSSHVKLSWTASTDNAGVVGYYIYRNDSIVNISSTNSFTDWGLEDSTDYNFSISAYDAAKNESPRSNTINVTTEPSGIAIPLKEFKLEQNHSNPFNSSTTIDYSLPTTSHVTLKIYDITGREIKTLVDEVKPAGKYTVEWNGTDRTGKKVPSGTYFYQIKSENGNASSKKMILVK